MLTDVALSALADVNPKRIATHSMGEDPVTFIPMSDVSESGRWLHRQTRPYREVCNGYTCFSEGDVLFAKITPCTENGKGCHATHIVGGVGFASTEFHVLRARDDADAGFIFQWSIDLSLRQKAAAMMTGSAGQQRVPALFFSSFTVPRLPRTEQCKIAEVLSTVDRAIAQTEALIAKQQRIKTGLMQDLLTRGIDEHGQLRSEATHAFKDSPLGRIPVEWEVKLLGAALDEAKGRLQTGPFGSQLHAHEYTHVGVPVVMPQDILQGAVSTASIARIPETRAHDLRRHRVMENDIVFSRRGDLSRAAAIGTREVGWLCGTGCFLLRVPPKNMAAKWLAHLYRHHWIQRQIETNAVGSTMPSLNNGVMAQLLVPLPSVNEQRSIADRIDAMENESMLLEQQLNKQQSLKTALMQDLLTGKVRVTPLLEQAKEATA